MFRRCKNKYLFHKWGDWKKYTNHVMNPGNRGIWYSEIRQERFCERCNKCQDIFVRG